MPPLSRVEAAEQYFQSLIQAANVGATIKVAARPLATVVNDPKTFVLYWDHTARKNIIVNRVGAMKIAKTLTFEGLLFVTNAGLQMGDARIDGYPIMAKIEAALLGMQPDLSAFNANLKEMIGPVATGDCVPVQVATGKYALLLGWEFDMSYSQGVA